MTEINDIYETGLLLDFYGKLLTKSQFDCLDMYCNDDMSLAEIAECLNISRQGVHDFIKRGKASLEEYEEKLGIIARFNETKTKLSEVRTELELTLGNIGDTFSGETVRKAIDNLVKIEAKL